MEYGEVMTVDTYPDLFWAYTAVWVILAIYIAAIGARLARLERTLSKEISGQVNRAECCDSKR